MYEQEMRVFEEELAEILKDCGEDDWDGYYGNAVTIEAINQTREFAYSLPSWVPPPETCALPYGTVDLTWRLAGWFIAAGIDADGKTTWGGLHNDKQVYGDCRESLLTALQSMVDESAAR